MYLMKAFGVSILCAEIAMVGVAIIHTLFNAINTVLLLPIKKLLIKFCTFVVPDKEEKQHTIFLDERIFNNPPLALSECRRLTNEMALYARDSLIKSIELITNYSAEVSQSIRELETITDKYEDKPAGIARDSRFGEAEEKEAQ